MATAPTPISALPTAPDPSSNSSTFDAAAYAWTIALPAFVSSTNALGDTTYNNAVEAAASAVTATTGAGTATTQAGIATLAAGTATTQAASVAALDKRYLGSKATAPTLDNQGDALAAGAVYYDTALSKVRTWTGSAWVEGISAVAGGADLRSMSPAAGDAAVVDGLGLFAWESGSTEPDDDESCFATATGRWLLEAAHWDLVDSWQAPELQALTDDDEDEPLRFATSFDSKIMTGSATCAITSVASSTSTSFTGTVTGAAIGDRVIATPPAQLGAAGADTGRLSYHAWVSTTNTVTVMLCNASAATATTNAAIQAAWPITVIKS